MTTDGIKSYAPEPGAREEYKKTYQELYKPKPIPKPTVKTDYQFKAESWYSMGEEYRKKAGVSEERVATLWSNIQRITAQTYGTTGIAKGTEPQNIGASATTTMKSAAFENLVPLSIGSTTVYVPIGDQTRQQIRQDIDLTTAELSKDIYYASVYQELPLVISAMKTSGETPDPAIILNQVGSVPPTMTSEEYDRLLEDVQEMVDAVLPAWGEELPEMALEADEPILPALEAPEPTAGQAIPVTMNQLTVEEIMKSMVAPTIPPSVLSEEEWLAYLSESGQISETSDQAMVSYYKEQAQAMIDAWKERDNMLQAYRQGIAEMPEFEAVDLLKEMVVMPGMALLDVGRFYFEHVSQPLAGLAWSHAYRPAMPWEGEQMVEVGRVKLPLVQFGFSRDIEAEYQRYRLEDSTWKALSHAWESWDAPGEGAWSWMLKYMLMEGLTDPMSYLGWGIATKITRPLGAFGRAVAGFERGFSAVCEIPFDALKFPLRARWAPELVAKLHLPERYAGQFVVPRTLAQRATIAMHEAGQYVEVALTKRFGKALWQMNQVELQKGVQQIVTYTLRMGNQVDNDVTRAGKQLLKHAPFSQKDVIAIGRRLGSTLEDSHITKQTVETVDRIFEDFFSTIRKKNKLATSDETASRLLAELSATNNADTMVLAKKVLEDRAKTIITGATSIGKEKSTLKAVRTLMRRNYNVYIRTEESTASLARMEMGAMRSMLNDIEYRVGKVWANTIDRWVIRTFAESYLCFALYGPMNVVEDVIRHGLGGAFPGTKTYKALTRKWYGTRMDQNLAMADKGISETFGALRDSPIVRINNWIAQINGLSKVGGFGNKIYDVMLGAPGRIGAGVRIHYIDAMATRVLKEIGGEQFERLAKAATKFSGTTDAKINRQVNQAATELAAVGASRDAFNALKTEFTRKAILRRELDNILMEHPNLARSVRDYIMKTFDDDELFLSTKAINDIADSADALIIDDFLNSAEHAYGGYELLAQELTALEVRNPEEMAQLIRALNYMSNMSGATPRQILGRAVEKTRGLPLADRRETLDKVMDSITIFRERSGASMDKVVDKIKKDMAGGLYDNNPQYILGSEHLFDLQSAKRVRANELGDQINGWRHNYFADAKPEQLKTQEFWDTYSHELSARWDLYDVEMAQLDSAIDNAIEDLNGIGGVPSPTRAPIKVVDRPLATNDIARLLQCRGDDISRTLLDTMVAQNSRNHFVAYVMGKVKPGDEGFTKETVGAVYDSLMNELVGGAQNASWVSGQRLELEAARKDLHNLYNSKLLPEEQATNISTYLDATADRVEEIMYAKPSSVDISKITFEGVSKSQRRKFSTWLGELPPGVSNDIKGVKMLKAGEHPFYSPTDGIINVPPDISKESMYHEVAHGILKADLDKGDFSMIQRYSEKFTVRGESFTGYQTTYEGLADVKESFLNIKGEHPEWSDLDVESYMYNSNESYFNYVESFANDFGTYVSGERLFDTPGGIELNTFFGQYYPLRGMPGSTGRVLSPEYTTYADLKQQAMDEAHKWYYKEFTDYTNANAFDAIMKSIYPFWCVPSYVRILTKEGWKHYNQLCIGEDVLVVDPQTLMTRWEPVQDIATFDYDDDLMVIPAKGKNIEFTPNHRWLVTNKNNDNPRIKRGYQLADNYDLIPRALPHEFPEESALSPRDAAILGWCCTDGYINRPNGRKPRMVIYQSLHKYLLEIQTLTGMRGSPRLHTGYSTEDSCDFAICVKQQDADRILSICPDWASLPELVTRLSKPAAEAIWDAMFKAEGYAGKSYNGRDNWCWKQNLGPVMGAFQILSIMLGKAITVSGNRVNILNNNKPYCAKEARRMRTSHYKGKVWCPVTPSGTWFANFNGCILPTGNTYESQRWFWLPRSFVRHPGTFTSFERWQDNTEYGYVHIPGTSLDINPFRGTIYGTLTTRLARRDFPEYYDSLNAAGNALEFSDFLSRYGFYPGAHIGVPIAIFGGQEMQFGESLPPFFKTPLDALIAAFPDNSSVKWISDRVFGERFRNYMTIITVNRMGGNGTLTFSKMQENQPLTPEEEQLWADARREVGAYSALFEQTGLFRWRTDEQYQMYEKASEVIEQITGYSPEQQDWLREHNYRLWDMVGGMSEAEQAMLEELDYYRWIGQVRPLLPGKQQEILNRLEVSWNDVEKYGDYILQQKLQLQRDFLNGVVGSTDYNEALLSMYDDQRQYLLDKMEAELTEPLPDGLTKAEREEFIETHSLMTLEGRKDYYTTFNVPQPVLHPMRELINLYFSIKLEETTDPETGEKMMDWDNFWAQRMAVEQSILEEYKQEWEDFLARNSTRMEETRREVYTQYFRTYNGLWDEILSTYDDEEQRLINEYLYLERTNQNMARMEEIKSTISSKTGNLLISSFRSELSDARKALRYENPHLDAWLYYWGKTSSFVAPGAEEVYRRIAKETGRVV